MRETEADGEGSMPANYDRLSRAELVERLKRLESSALEREELEKVVHELKVHQEELDIQNRQLIEMQGALEESRDRYADLYDFAPLAYCTLDSNGMIKEANLTLAQLLSVERARLVGSHLHYYVAPPFRPHFIGYLRRCRNEAEPVAEEFTLRQRDGQEIPVELSTVPPRISSHKGLYRTMIIDLSERRRAEEERHHLMLKEEAAHASSEAKDRFLAILSHELRSPLTPVLAVLSSLEKAAAHSPEVRQDLEMIRRNIELEARLIDDLLDLTSITRGKLQLHFSTLDLNEVIRHVVQSMRPAIEEKRLGLSESLKAEHHFVMGDASRLMQVFLNILKNAVKFTPREGRISLATWNETVREPPGHPRLKIAVSDTGIGMEPGVVPRVFQAFEQGMKEVSREFGGLGLGLAIARGIVEGHGGRISALSEGKGKGASFEIELPTEPKPAAPSATAAQGPEKQATPLRVLLVEDHSDTARVLARLLSAHGHQVTVAESVQEALEKMREDIDIIVSDLGLPDGTGLEFMRKVKERSPRTPGIALSGFGTQEDVRKSREAGFAEHLTKPVALEKLLQAVARVTVTPVA